MRQADVAPLDNSDAQLDRLRWIPGYFLRRDANATPALLELGTTCRHHVLAFSSLLCALVTIPSCMALVVLSASAALPCPVLLAA